MAISSITITQDNKVGSSDLLPIHSPLVFLADVTYSEAVPDVIFVEIRNEDNEILETYKAIPFQDPLLTSRIFAFKSSLPIRALMNNFGEQYQALNTLELVENITKKFKIRFVDPDDSGIYDEIEATFIHGAAQYGTKPNKTDIYNGVDSTYYGVQGGFVYAYFYNNNTSNTLTVTVS